MGPNVRKYSHISIMEREINKTAEKVECFLDSLSKCSKNDNDPFSSGIAMFYIFIISELQKEHENIAQIISETLSADIPSTIADIISDYTIIKRDLSILKHQDIKSRYNEFLIACFNALKMFASAKISQNWMYEMRRIVLLDNEYRKYLCDYIFSLSLGDIVSFCLYPKIAEFVKALTSGQDLQCGSVKILNDFDLKYKYYTDWCGRLLINIYEKIQTEESVKITCDQIKKHVTFTRFDMNQIKQILNAFVDEAKKKNIKISLDNVKAVIQNELEPKMSSGEKISFSPL